MSQSVVSVSQRRAQGVSTPGGLGRQCRVQFQAACDSQWRMYASFRHQDSALACADGLIGRGLLARVVSYNFCPAAS